MFNVIVNTAPRECQFGEFQCSSGLCIPRVLVCNGEVDCGVAGNQDDSDETQNCQEFHVSLSNCKKMQYSFCLCCSQTAKILLMRIKSTFKICNKKYDSKTVLKAERVLERLERNNRSPFALSPKHNFFNFFT